MNRMKRSILLLSNNTSLGLRVYKNPQGSATAFPPTQLATKLTTNNNRTFHTCSASNIRVSTIRLMSSGQQTQTASKSESDVLFETIGGKGVITLNRPRALNALNLSMIRKIYPTLREWESANKQFVIIKAVGEKAFCAGGDIKSVTDSAKERSQLYQDFFREEYQLNALIGTLQMPYIAIIDGITMGGGVGLSVHGRYRIATERTVFAMPETAIGLFPDVGGGYFLPRLGGKLGLYLALTGYRLKGGDVFKSGVATHMCDSCKLGALEQDLISLDSNKPKDIEQVLKKYHDQSPEIKKAFGLESRMNDINRLFEADSVEQILSQLKEDGSAWAAKTAETMGKMSPISLKITQKLLQMGEALDLTESLQFEYRLSQRCCEDHDFIEGVRAMLVDKDQSPKWKPNSLKDVTSDMVDKYFSPLSSEKELSV